MHMHVCMHTGPACTQPDSSVPDAAHSLAYLPHQTVARPSVGAQCVGAGSATRVHVKARADILAPRLQL